MRVVGNFEPEFSTENDVGKAFDHLGQEVIRPRRTERAGPQVREAVLDLDLLLITSTWDEALPFGEMIKLLRDCAMRGIPTGTLHLAIFFGSDRGSRRWWANIQFFTRYVFTADGSHQDEWNRLGVDHRWLPPQYAMTLSMSARQGPSKRAMLRQRRMQCARPCLRQHP